MSGLKEYRIGAGLTQAELAARSGIRQATISALENGRSTARAGTVLALATALEIEPSRVRALLDGSQTEAQLAPVGSPIEALGDDWEFLRGLDADLRDGLARALVANWTHGSTALEGNTITAGDTLFVLTEGLTISGKSLGEHQELIGHAEALRLMAAWTRAGQPVRVDRLHELHRAVMTGATFDVFAPTGAWKIEPNGTNAMTTDGRTQWHDYAEPGFVPALMKVWIRALHRISQQALKTARVGSPNEFLIDAYTDVHLGLSAIHPYADGNGRLARLLANLPLLRSGRPPLLVDSARRREYLTLLGDYSIARGQPRPGEELVRAGAERNALRGFFKEEWQATLELVDEFHARQQAR